MTNPLSIDSPVSATMTVIESPCIQVCQLDDNAGICTGCGRTRFEIAGWGRMTPVERREIMDALPDRLDAWKADRRAVRVRPSQRARAARET